jgi:NADH pyrophosphatase NudC (nudix superfamily)
MSRIDDLDAHWRELSEEVIVGMKEWRIQHPKATFQEIETALDERLARLRARMLQDAALASRAADLSATPAEERPRCPECGTPLEPHGQETRTLTTHYDHPLDLKRSYAVCPQCHVGLFPPR